MFGSGSSLTYVAEGRVMRFVAASSCGTCLFFFVLVIGQTPVRRTARPPSYQVVKSSNLSWTVMPMPAADHTNIKSMNSVIEHVFMPPKLPQSHPSEGKEHELNVMLCVSLIKAARDFLKVLPSSQHPLWMQIIKMMELAHRAAEAPLTVVELQRVLLDMAIGGTYR
jgi:hypothetical protein